MRQLIGFSVGLERNRHSGAQPPSNAEFDQINRQVSTLNTAFNALKTGLNACPVTGPHPRVIGTCVDQAYTSSGIDTALADFHQQISRIQSDLDPGVCRSALGRFDSTMAMLRQAGATLGDAAIAEKVARLKDEVSAVRNAWRASANAIADFDKPC